MTARRACDACPTLYLQDEQYHVLVPDLQLGFDMPLPRSAAVFVICFEEEPIELGFPEDLYPAELDRRLRTLRIPKRLALGWAAKRGLYEPAPSLKKAVVHRYEKYLRDAARWFGEATGK